MVEANHSISRHTPLTIAQRQRMAVMTLAMRNARKEVERHMKSHRLRLCDVEHREIVSWALVYLDDHPELIDAARPMVESWFARGVFGKRAQRAFCAKLESDAQQAQPHKSITSTVQNSGAERRADQ